MSKEQDKNDFLKNVECREGVFVQIDHNQSSMLFNKAK